MKDIIDAKRNADPALIAREAPMLDLTRHYIGYNPRQRFKVGYRKSLNLTDNQLIAKVKDMHQSGEPLKKIVPYIYDMHRRGLPPLPEITKSYKPITDDHVRDLSVISGEASEKYVDANVRSALALTLLAGKDYIDDNINKRFLNNPDATRLVSRYNAARGANIKHELASDITKITTDEGEKKIVTPSNYGDIANALGQHRTQSVVSNIKNNFLRKLLHGADEVAKTDLSKYLGRKDPIKSRFMERAVGAFSSMPAISAATLPLMFKPVTGTLKGDKEKTKRYKVFDFVEKHPGEIMAATMAPRMISQGIDAGVGAQTAYKYAPRAMRGQAVRQSLAKSTGNIARTGLLMSVPLAFFNMRKVMDTASDKEKKLLQDMQK